MTRNALSSGLPDGSSDATPHGHPQRALATPVASTTSPWQ